MPKRLTNLQIDEVSSVDRGAGEGVDVVLMKRHGFAKAAQLYTSIDKGDLADSVVVYLKREFSDDERREAADSGAALPDGSFPIKTKEDLSNAIQAIGRAKDRAKAMAHIKTRARALGATDMLPDSWSKRDDKAQKALALCIDSILNDDSGVNKASALTELFKQFAAYTGDHQEDDMPAITLEKSDLEKLIGEVVGKALKDAGVAVLKMSDEHKAFHAKLKGDAKDKFAAMEPAERDEYMEKNPIGKNDGDGDADDEKKRKEKEAKKRHDDACVALAKATGLSVEACSVLLKAKKEKTDGNSDHGGSAEDEDERDGEGEGAHKGLDTELAKRDDKIASLTKKLAVLEVDKQKGEFAKRAVELGMSEAQGEMLRKAHMGDPDALKKLEETIKGLNEQVKTGKVFEEFGGAGGENLQKTAHEQLVNKANEIRKADPKLTQEQAYVKAMEGNPDLVRAESQERHARINGGRAA